MDNNLLLTDYCTGMHLWRRYIDEINSALGHSSSLIWRFLVQDEIFTYDEKYYVLGGSFNSRVSRIGDVMLSRISGASTLSHPIEENNVRSIFVLLYMLRYVTAIDYTLAVSMVSYFHDRHRHIFRALNERTGGQLSTAYAALLECTYRNWA